MDYILNMVLFFFWILAFYIGFFAVYKLLDSKFIKSEEIGTRWNDLRESLITLVSLVGGGLVITSIAYFFKEDSYVAAKLVSLLLICGYLLFVIMLLAKWLDEKFDRKDRKTFEHSYYFLAIIIFFSSAWINAENRRSKEEQTRIKHDLRFEIESHLLGNRYESLGMMEQIKVRMEPERMFVSNCVTNFIFENYSKSISTILWSINPNPIVDFPEDKSSIKKEAISIFYNQVNFCTDLREILKPEFRQLIETKLFNDLRLDLAKSARESFFAESFRRGPKFIKKYISFIGLSQDKGNISRGSLKSDGEKWATIDEKYGYKLKNDIDHVYKVANCEHIERRGPSDGFQRALPPDEKTLAKRKKCREEKDLP
jgi:hypothetical protein